MASFSTGLRLLTIGIILTVASGCDEEYWFNADGSGRNRWILNEGDIAFFDSKGKGFDEISKKNKEYFAKTKLRFNMTRDVVFGKTRWIVDLAYDSIDQLSWIDDKKEVMDARRWKSTTQPNGDLKHEYKEKLVSDPDNRDGVGWGSPRLVTVHLPAKIIKSNADDVDETKHVAIWDTTTHKSITPTVIVRLPTVAKNKKASKPKPPTGPEK
jgi:hypothetical protein